MQRDVHVGGGSHVIIHEMIPYIVPPLHRLLTQFSVAFYFYQFPLNYFNYNNYYYL